MVLKIFKVLWFFSLGAVLGNFLFIYASLPETVTILDSSRFVTISREALFYISLVSIAVINMLVFIVNKVFTDKHLEFRAWFYGLVVTLNLFFIITFSFVQVYNSNERYDYQRLGGIIYGSVILIVIWALAWPFYSFGRKIFTKPTA